MRVHTLQHVPFEGLGSIQSWLESRSAEVGVTRLFEEARFPDLREVDGVVVLGGPMSVNDEDLHPWLAAEKRFIAEAIAASKGVLGICLGAQLIASALGAKVFANPEREIGWFPVEPVPEAARSAFASLFEVPREVFHWHGETFELPPGAAWLARSDACEHQAFSIGERVLGLQFHLETTAASARALIENCPGDLAPGRWVQSGRQILGKDASFRRIHRVMASVLDRWEELALRPGVAPDAAREAAP
jgi:GMP synthase-like glutamine amidotransferase